MRINSADFQSVQRALNQLPRDESSQQIYQERFLELELRPALADASELISVVPRCHQRLIGKQYGLFFLTDVSLVAFGCYDPIKVYHPENYKMPWKRLVNRSDSLDFIELNLQVTGDKEAADYFLTAARQLFA